MKGSLVPCGHTFSDFQIYDEKTAKEEYYGILESRGGKN